MVQKIVCPNGQFLQSMYRIMTLKIRSWSPKSNHLFPLSQQLIYTNLVKIHPLVQKVMCLKTDFYSLYRIVTLKIRSRSPKFKPYFGRKLTFQSTGVTLKIRSRSANLINSKPPLNNIYASLVKIEQLVWKIVSLVWKIMFGNG